MRIYKHTGKGHYIGSVIIVVAEYESDAIEAIRNELNKNGLMSENLNIVEYEIKPGMVHSDNGDY